jgi:hypothetical protein
VCALTSMDRPVGVSWLVHTTPKSLRDVTHLHVKRAFQKGPLQRRLLLFRRCESRELQLGKRLGGQHTRLELWWRTQGALHCRDNRRSEDRRGLSMQGVSVPDRLSKRSSNGLSGDSYPPLSAPRPPALQLLSKGGERGLRWKGKSRREHGCRLAMLRVLIPTDGLRCCEGAFQRVCCYGLL